MTIQIPDKDVEYLKDLCKCFNEMTAYVHEGVIITVDKNGGADDHEACRALSNFVDRCVYPETMDMLSDILDQINGNNNVKKESEFVFRIKQSDFNDPANFEDGVKDMQLLIKFLCAANPNYYLLGNVLDKQLNEQLKEVKQ